MVDVMPAPSASTKSIPRASKAIPFIGNTMEMGRDPAAFFVRCYKDHGPVYQVNVFGRKQYVIAGTEAAKFMSTKAGREGLRSKEFWDDFVDHFGASKALTQIDGEEHRRLRSIMRAGFSREAAEGQYHKLAEYIDSSISRDWKFRSKIGVLEAYQYMIVQMIGELMSGEAPLEYVKDIRVNILFLLNVLVARVKPKFYLKNPRFKKASKRVTELGDKTVAMFMEHAENGTLPKNLLGDIMRAHFEDPEFVQKRDLAMLLTGPYVAGLDTVANTVAGCTYGILKTPGVLQKVQAEADALYAKNTVTEADVRSLQYIQGCIKEAMRIWPVAVAQMRTTTKDIEFEGHIIPEGEMILIGTSVPHYLEEYFPNPRTFDPERYNPDRKEHMKPGAYAPFGRGPHTCLGQNLAEVLMGMIISRVFHRLDLALESPNYELKTKAFPTPGPAMSFKIKVLGERKPAKALTPEVLEDI
jgi:cytochrome P450